MMNIQSVPSSKSFINTVSDNIIASYDKLSITDLTLITPNSRTSESFREYFKGKIILLPKIYSIDDIVEDDFLITILSGKEANLPSVISSVKAQMILISLIEKWQENTGSKQFNTAAISNLAKQLYDLLEELERYFITIDDLENIVDTSLAVHWQENLKFIKIIYQNWDQILQASGGVCISKRRNMALNFLSKAWQEKGAVSPVIIAGSTGSVPASCNFIKTIASMSNGKVILSGLDGQSDDISWESINPVHPQYALKKLLDALDVQRKAVITEDSGKPRSSVMSHIFRPAATFGDASYDSDIIESCFKNIQLYETSSSEEEASIISFMLREIIEAKDKNAALVTNDSNLTKRVAAKMLRWNVVADISSGIPLIKTEDAVLFDLIVKAVESKLAPVELLALLKHPLCRFSYSRLDVLKNVKILERDALRKKQSSFDDYITLLKDDNIVLWLQNIYSKLQPLLALFETQSISFKQLLDTHMQVFLNVISDIEGITNLTQAGQQLIDCLNDVKELSVDDYLIEPGYYFAVLLSLIGNAVYRPKYGAHPRVRILSPMEARLQEFDLVILAGLNEGNWPERSSSDMWMNKSMRSTAGFPDDEFKIGQSTSDFMHIVCSNNNVILTRSVKDGGVQTKPSRFIMRMKVYLEKHGLKDLLSGDEKYLAWYQKLYHVSNITKISPPLANPPANIRPKKFSATEIEKLICDPYAVYAKKILNLKKIDNVGQELGNSDFGNFIHNLLEIFCNNFTEKTYHQHLEYFIECADNLLKKDKVPDYIKAFWRPKYLRIANWFINNEVRTRNMGINVTCEHKGEFKIGDATIYAIADRIENLDNNIYVVDYKTGTLPSISDISNFFKPQIILEAIIANNNGFGISGRVEKIGLWQVTGREDQVKIYSLNGEKLEYVINDSLHKLEQLTSSFITDAPFLACPNPSLRPKYNDYDHLERLDEWCSV